LKLLTTLAVLVALVLLVGCSTQARTPWGNVDFKGGSGSECKPWVAPDGGARQLPQMVRPVRPLVPNAPVIVAPPPVAAPVPEPVSVIMSGAKWPPAKGKPLTEVACIE